MSASSSAIPSHPMPLFQTVRLHWRVSRSIHEFVYRNIVARESWSWEKAERENAKIPKNKTERQHQDAALPKNERIDAQATSKQQTWVQARAWAPLQYYEKTVYRVTKSTMPHNVLHAMLIEELKRRGLAKEKGRGAKKQKSKEKSVAASTSKQEDRKKWSGAGGWRKAFFRGYHPRCTSCWPYAIAASCWARYWCCWL